MYHPDRNSTPNAAIHFKRVNAAYQVLGDPARREAYDALTGQVEPPPPSTREGTATFVAPPPDSAPEGWYLGRNGTTEGPVRPEVIVSWIASGLRDGMVRFGAGEWHPLSRSVFARFIPPQTIPPAMPPAMPPPRLLYVSDPNFGRKRSHVALKIIAGLIIAIALSVAVFWFFGPRPG